MKTSLIATAAVALLGAGLAGAAHADITTFATFSALTADNFYLKNASSSNKSANSSFYTIATPGSTTAGTVGVEFSFINLGSVYDNTVKNVVADLNWTSASSSAAQNAFGLAIQPNNGGSFTITSTAPITLGSTTYAAGSVLLAGTYTGGGISGAKGSTSGGFDVSSAAGSGGTVTFTSAFLTFNDETSLDAALNLTSVTTPGANAGLASEAYGTDGLETFKTDVGGSFSADPGAQTIGVPEPASWAMMLLGLGAIGGLLRRRSVIAGAI
jgi:PEP-CTERM motif